MKPRSLSKKLSTSSATILSRNLCFLVVMIFFAIYIIGVCLIFFTSHEEEEQRYGGSSEMLTDPALLFQQKEKERQTAGNNNPLDKTSISSLPSYIRLETSNGDILIQMRPDLSRESVEYIQRLLNDPRPCEHCRFYRAQDRGILQGIMKKYGVEVNKVLGPCSSKNVVNKEAHDMPKKCHGPIMTRGMVGWAGGGAGPDFFIDNYKRKAQWWGQEHTVFGEVDPSSLHVVESFFDLPRHSSDGGMMFLDEAIPFDIKPIESYKYM